MAFRGEEKTIQLIDRIGAPQCTRLQLLNGLQSCNLGLFRGQLFSALERRQAGAGRFQ
jgi:hypothetical protein